MNLPSLCLSLSLNVPRHFSITWKEIDEIRADDARHRVTKERSRRNHGRRRRLSDFRFHSTRDELTTAPPPPSSSSSSSSSFDRVEARCIRRQLAAWRSERGRTPQIIAGKSLGPINRGQSAPCRSFRIAASRANFDDA